MNCSDIMNKNVEWLTEQDSIRKAATVMAEAGVGFLPICDAEKRYPELSAFSAAARVV